MSEANNLLSFFQGLENSGLGTVVRKSLWLFPVIECIHLLALSLLGGAVLVVNLRMLGFGLKSEPSADLARKVQPWLVLSVVAIIATGIPMFLSEAIKCFYSPPFWYKMSMLALAIVFTFTAHRKVAYAQADRFGAGLVRLTAIVSIALWFGVGFAGRWIAFY